MVDAARDTATTGADRRRRWTVLATLLGSAALLVVVWRFDPDRAPFYPPCWFHRITGLHCPGCGTTRCLHALLHGDLAQAAANNVLSLALLPVVLAWLCVRLTESMWGVRLPRLHFPRWFGWVVAGALLVFWILRNVPLFPCTLLAPHRP